MIYSLLTHILFNSLAAIGMKHTSVGHVYKMMSECQDGVVQPKMVGKYEGGIREKAKCVREMIRHYIFKEVDPPPQKSHYEREK